jgi:alpha-D-ribose 1-methylphosphonate 5-triphosphate synthase subunit PhnG
MNHYHVLAHCSEEQVCQLAMLVLEAYPASQVKLLSGPRQGLVMLRMRETVAESLFNAGEILVTEVRIELDGQFGFGMVIGDSPRQAMAIALVDAALRKGEEPADKLTDELVKLNEAISRDQLRLQQLVASTTVNFERM